jgi:preprotein translocase SecE subunit
MLTFFYDSLESLKKVKVPTTKEVINLTIVILVVVIIAALVFALYDGIFA